MPNDDPIVALLVSDLHLSLRPPLARSCEKDWLVIQAGYLRQLEEMLPSWETPIICAGDLFDRFQAPAELVNWCLDNLPQMFCVVGQHDLVHHDLTSLPKTSFWTLVKAKKLTYIDPQFPTRLPLGSTDPGLVLHGFPWGVPLKPLDRERQKQLGNDRALHVAVVHRYLWSDKSGGYPGAPEDCKLSQTRKNLIGYDAAVFGDNHCPWLYPGNNGSCPVLNHGAFILRKQDERKYVPTVGLLHASGRITTKLLDTSADRWLDPEPGEVGSVLAGLDEFLGELEAAGEGSELDFDDAVRRWLDGQGVKGRVRRRVLEALEVARGKA